MNTVNGKSFSSSVLKRVKTLIYWCMIDHFASDKSVSLMIRAVRCKNVSLDICGQRRPRSACASTQSDQGHSIIRHCRMYQSLD